jgi:hypothetical protein
MAGPPSSQMSVSLYRRESKVGQRAFSRVDLLMVVITALALGIFALLIPQTTKGDSRRIVRRITCSTNLRQIGIASREWADQHGSNFVWQTSMTNAGAPALTASEMILAGFLVMTNELRSPKILTCPSDKLRQKANSFADLSQKNISYFIALDCPFEMPQAILAGDRNVEQTNANRSPRIVIPPGTRVAWTAKELHQNAGNLLLADGSSQQVSQVGLAKQIQAQFATSTNASITWLLP